MKKSGKPKNKMYKSCKKEQKGQKKLERIKKTGRPKKKM